MHIFALFSYEDLLILFVCVPHSIYIYVSVFVHSLFALLFCVVCVCTQRVRATQHISREPPFGDTHHTTIHILSRHVCNKNLFLVTTLPNCVWVTQSSLSISLYEKSSGGTTCSDAKTYWEAKAEGRNREEGAPCCTGYTSKRYSSCGRQ